MERFLTPVLLMLLLATLMLSLDIGTLELSAGGALILGGVGCSSMPLIQV